MKRNLKFLTALTIIIFSMQESFACSRVVYQGLNGLILTGRNMDWSADIEPNIWVQPRGIQRDGGAGISSIKWKSKYGSVTTTSWDISSQDGMNEKGLVANMLWLADAQFPDMDKSTKKPSLNLSLWLQYVLDNFATVDEAVKALSKEEFIVVTMEIPGTTKLADLHLAISDANGDNAIFEYINKKLVIHHDKSFVVMTNEPAFDKQLAINTYWQGIPGNVMLPGTSNPTDRFVRGSYYINSVPKSDDAKIAVPTLFSIMRNMSAPLGVSTPGHPNVSATRWRSVADQKNLVYYFDDVLNPSAVWLDFKNLDFSENAPIKKLTVSKHDYTFARESSQFLVNSNLFNFLTLPK